MARETRSERPFRFLDLPAELRNRVYIYALTEEKTKKIPIGITGYDVAFAIDHIPQVNTSLLLCCKQIHKEAKDFPFELNTFTFTISKFHTQPAPECWYLWPRIRNIDIIAHLESREATTQLVEHLTQWSLNIRTVTMLLFLPTVEATLNAIVDLENMKVADKAVVYTHASLHASSPHYYSIPAREELRTQLASSLPRMMRDEQANVDFCITSHQVIATARRLKDTVKTSPALVSKSGVSRSYLS